MLGLATMVTAAELPSYALAVKDGQFTPTKIEVPAGVKFKLAVTNVGRGPEEFESRELNREKVIPAGQSVTILIGPLKVGTYEFFGEYHPSTARGQIVAK
ncbi:MAG: cupredoxin domain-containing protein [Gammaproteobacteria bacterium]|nr:cupredoxin domain-containing protein [Gammaproteobacteria bacterium]